MVGDAVEQALRDQYELLSPHLDERGQRLVLGAMATVLHDLRKGGVSKASRLTGAARQTVSRGVGEVHGKPDPGMVGRTRLPGGGRKLAEDAQPGLREALDRLVSPTERGDPESPLRWTTKSTYKLSDELGELGYSASQPVVRQLLRSMGYSLQANSKTIEGAQHPDRDMQFAYINGLAASHLAAGQPLISVDTMKKEQPGNFAGQVGEWERVGKPVPVGTDHDTAAFAVESIRQWWQSMGSAAYPDATRLMITADAGGSNDHRRRTWEWELSRLATEIGLEIVVCHYPPGTSKWNKIEHRLFSHVSMNWRGRPLVDHDVMIGLIGIMTTRAGLKINTRLDRGEYPTGIKIGDAQMAEIPIDKADFHGEWNYVIKNRK